MKLTKTLCSIIILILFFIFCISTFYLGVYFWNSLKQRQQYDDLAAIVESVRQDAPAAPTTEGSSIFTPNTDPDAIFTPEEAEMLPEYQALWELNSDMVGWLSIPGTNVNYPVMQTPDQPDFYLKRDFYKETAAQGALYADEGCDINLPSDNVTIYGHNMKDGSMFADLKNYLSKDFYQSHSFLTFDTLTERHTYQIFAVFKTTATAGKGFKYHRFIDADNEEEFDAFVAECKANSFYDTGLTPAYGFKIICLSTCEYTLENGRLVVAAVRVN